MSSDPFSAAAKCIASKAIKTTIIQESGSSVGTASSNAIPTPNSNSSSKGGSIFT